MISVKFICNIFYSLNIEGRGKAVFALHNFRKPIICLLPRTYKQAKCVPVHQNTVCAHHIVCTHYIYTVVNKTGPL